MAICPKCEGRGWVDNPSYLRNFANACYILYDPTKPCRKCKGTGYVIADVKDAIDILKVWKNNPRGIFNRDFKQAIEILEKIFDE